MKDTQTFVDEKVPGLLPYPAETVKYNQIVMYKELGQAVKYALAPLYLPTDRWVYLSDQRPNEALLFTQYDTRQEMPRMCWGYRTVSRIRRAHQGTGPSIGGPLRCKRALSPAPVDEGAHVLR